MNLNKSLIVLLASMLMSLSLQAEDGIRDTDRSRGLGDVYKRQTEGFQFEIGTQF